MAFSALTIERFTAFREANFDLAPGVNVLIGENGSGKTHVLKLLYTLHEVSRRYWSPSATSSESLDVRMEKSLRETFLPDEGAIGRLVQRTQKGAKTATVAARYHNASIGFSLTHKGRLKATSPADPINDGFKNDQPAVFLPAREMLSIFPGFVSDWEERESTFDRTYFDLCILLGKSPLRGPRDEARGALIAPLEEALGGTIESKGGRFYLHQRDGEIEMPLLAEGLRKIAQLAYLVLNGSLQRKGLLLWDEPEANINPEKSALLASTILKLARGGVQVVVATHDYVLASELSRQIESHEAGVPECAFFAIRRDIAGQRQVERASAFALLQTNPILDAMAALHDRELATDPPNSP